MNHSEEKQLQEYQEWVSSLEQEIDELRARCGDLVVEEIITSIIKDEQIAALETHNKQLLADVSRFYNECEDALVAKETAEEKLLQLEQSLEAQQPAKEQGKNREKIEPPTQKVLEELWELMEKHIVSNNLDQEHLPEAIRLVRYNRKER